jgi:hypothetical protein
MKLLTFVNVPAWVTWHLGSTLARSGYPTCLVDLDPDGALTKALLTSIYADAWTHGQLQGLAAVLDDAPPSIVELRDDPDLSLLPGLQGRQPLPDEDTANRRLCEWLAQSESDIVILHACSTHQAQPWRPAIQKSALAVHSAHLTIDALRQFRHVGGWLLPSVKPASMRYIAIEPRFRGVLDDATTDYIGGRLPRIFRTVTLGRGDVEASALPQLAADPLCVGRLIDRKDPVPIWRLPPGTGDAPHDLRTARHRFEDAARKLLIALDFEHPPAPAEPPPGPQPINERYVQPASLAAGSGGDDRLTDRLPSGFLDLNATQGTRSISNAIAEQPAAILLGQAGIGKSRIAAELGGKYVFIGSARGAVTERNLLDRLKRAKRLKTIVLDGLDECPYLDELPDILEAWLSELTTPPTLRLFSRPRAALRALLPVLEAHYALKTVPVWQILPFRAADAAAVATPALMAAIEANGLQALAAHPLSLTQLQDQWAAHGALTGDRVDLFENSIARIAGHGQADPTQVLAAMRPLAWALVVGRHARIADQSNDPQTLNLNEFSVAFDVPKAALEAACRSTFLDADLHRSYWDFLAAKWIIRTEAQPEDVCAQLLFEGCFIPDHLQDLAGWLVTLSADFAAELVERDPALLLKLRAQVQPSARPAWLDALVEAHRVGRVHLHWFWHELAVVAAQPTDPDPIRLQMHARGCALLTQADRGLRKAGVEIVAGGQVGDWADQLLAVAHNAAEDANIRRDAAYGLEPAIEQHVEPLRTLWFAVDCPNPLRGALYHLLWPAHLTPLEVLQHLPENDRNLPFYSTQAQAVVFRLEDADLPAALGAIRKQTDEYSAGPPERELILRRAMACLNDDAVVMALADWLLDSATDSWRPRRLEVDWSEGQASDWRLFSALIDRAPDIRTMRLALWNVAITVPFEKVLAHLPEVVHVESGRRTRWLNAAFRLANPAQTEQLRFYASLDESLADNFRRLYAPRPFDDTDDDELGLDDEGEPISRMDFIRACCNGDVHPSWWPRFARTASLLSGNRVARPIFEDVVWNALTETERCGAIALAHRFLEWPEVPGDHLRNHASPAIRAWRLLRDADQLPKDTEAWSRWAALALLVSTDADDNRLRIAMLDRVPEAVADALPEALASAYNPATVLQQFLPNWPSALTKATLELLAQPADPNRYDHRTDILATLFDADPQAAWPWARERLNETWVMASILSRRIRKRWALLLPSLTTSDAIRTTLAHVLVGLERDLDDADLYPLTPDEIVLVDQALHETWAIPAPPESGVIYNSNTPRRRAEQVRNRLLRHLIERGAVEQVAMLIDRLPTAPTQLIEDARRIRAQRKAKPPSLADMAALKPRLESSTALQRLLISAMRRLQRVDLDGENSIAHIFNPSRREEVGCRLIASKLKHYLPDTVQLILEPQEFGGKDRIDIKALATVPSGTHVVKIEVKWVHHPKVKTAQIEQLSARYLKSNPDARGIYLVLWYPHALAPTKRIHAPWRIDPQPLQDLLDENARQVPRVKPFILRLPQIATQSDPRPTNAQQR